MTGSTGELASVLAELDALIRDEHPDHYPRFRPRLQLGEIASLSSALLPYHLPAELEVLYGWHDGWDHFLGGTYAPLLPDASFGSLADAICEQRGWLDVFGSEGWHPLWFPAFGEKHGELVVLQSETGVVGGQVYAYHAEDDLATSYDSVTTLFQTVIDCWRTGVYPPESTLIHPPGLRETVARHNPRSRLPDGASRRSISRWSTRDWPREWTEALGLTRAVPSADHEVVTIAELERDPADGGPVRGEVTGWGGSDDTWIVTVTDATGSVRALMSRELTENYREFRGGERFELQLRPLADTRPLDQLAEAMRHLGVVPAAAYVAVRLVPL